MSPITTGREKGFTYAKSIIQESAPHVSMATIQATLWMKGPHAYLVITYAPRGDKFEQFKSDFDAIHDSFRSYDKERDGDIPRIHLYTWKKGDSWESIANESGFILGRFTADRLAILNGMDPTQTPEAGSQIKIVR